MGRIHAAATRQAARSNNKTQWCARVYKHMRAFVHECVWPGMRVDMIADMCAGMCAGMLDARRERERTRRGSRFQLDVNRNYIDNQ